MKMRETSRGEDKKLHVNNNPKTYILKTLAKILGLPIAITDATNLTQAG